MLYVEGNRHVVPRWRDLSTTIRLGEVSAIGVPIERQSPIGDELWARKRNAWHLNSNSMFAAEFLETAIVAGRVDAAMDAANYLISSDQLGDQLCRQVARDVIIEHSTPGQLDIDLHYVDSDEAGKSLGLQRRRLRSVAGDGLGWLELGRLYDILAQFSKAKDALRVAMALAPENRYVLRSAASFFIQHGEPDRAMAMLNASQLIARDPWIIAAEISAASLADQSSRNLKRAKKLIKAKNPMAHEISELQSAIATMDLESGSIRHARRGFRGSLLAPTENSLAQAKWAARRIGSIDIDPELLDSVPLSHEAKAWEFYTGRHWEDAIAESWMWLRDQPSSPNPAIHGSYIATTALDAYEECEKLTRCGLVSNPNNFLLRNNLIVAMARGGNIKAARDEYQKIGQNRLEAREVITWIATAGLLAFRENKPEEGIECYRRAMDLAKTEGNKRLVVLAKLNFALEMIRSMPGHDTPVVGEAIADGEQNRDDPGIEGMLGRIKNMMGKKTGKKTGLVR